MRRWHEEYRIARRNWLARLKFGWPWPAPAVGRYRKTDAHDCGRPRCGVCHSDKFPRRTRRRHESRAAVGEKEQLAEFFGR